MRLFKFPLALAALCGMVLVAGMFTLRMRADEWNKLTILTVNQPIQIYDTYLGPGKYVLKLAHAPDRHAVEIFNSDQSRLIGTVMANPTFRLEVTDKPDFRYWETPAGTVKALRMWYYPGATFGAEFRYPTHLTRNERAAVTGS